MSKYNKNIYLVEPSKKLQEAFFDMLDDFRGNEENPKPSLIKCEDNDFNALIERLDNYSKGIGLKENHVANSTYFLSHQRRLIGTVNIRHQLNDNLYKYDGHIGGTIIPTERGKGYGTIMLKLALEKAKEMGINPILITCNKGNLASERTIIKNGGIFDTEETEDHGNVVRRFWFHL